jgi:hypothetical protein
MPVYREQVKKIVSVPNTMPPFHFTKVKNKARTDAYGMNDGRMSGRIFGTHRIVLIKSADDKNDQN